MMGLGTYFIFVLLWAPVSLKDQRLRDLNNGVAVPPGYHSYLVRFTKKKDFDDEYDKPLAKNPTDFSVSEQGFSSGTILTPRWILTRATPIAYYPIGSYEIVLEKHIPRVIEMDFVLIHPGHEPEDAKTDLALVRTTQALVFSFEVRNVNTGLRDAPINFDKCKLVLWALHFNDKVTKSELTINIKSTQCSNDADFEKDFLCLSNENKEHQPCGVNSGAPIVCDSVLAGVYIGTQKGAVCDGEPLRGFLIIRLDNSNTSAWLNNMLLPTTSKSSITEPMYQPRMCKSKSQTTLFSKFIILLIILNKHI